MKRFFLTIAILVSNSCIPPEMGPEGNIIFSEETSGFMYDLYGYRVEIEDDPFQKLKKISQVNNGGLGKGEMGHFICFNLILFEHNNGQVDLILEPIYRWDDWIFMKKISVLSDDIKFDYDISFSNRKTKVISGGNIIEWCYIPIKRHHLLDWIKSKELSIRIYGQQYYRDVKYTNYIKSNWKTFYDEYLSIGKSLYDELLKDL